MLDGDWKYDDKGQFYEHILDDILSKDFFSFWVLSADSKVGFNTLLSVMCSGILLVGRTNTALFFY